MLGGKGSEIIQAEIAPGVFIDTEVGDTLEGGKGDDSLNGGKGPDQIAGQQGNDTATSLDGFWLSKKLISQSSL